MAERKGMEHFFFILRVLTLILILDLFLYGENDPVYQDMTLYAGWEKK